MNFRQRLALRLAVGILRAGGMQPYFDSRVSASKKNVFGRATTTTKDLEEFFTSLKIERLLASDEVLIHRLHVDLQTDRRIATLQERIEAAGPGNVVTLSPKDYDELTKPRIVAGAMTGGRLHAGALAAIKAAHTCDSDGPLLPNPDTSDYSPSCSVCGEKVSP